MKTATHVVAKHVNQFGHEIDFEHAAVVDKDRGYHKRLFWGPRILRETEMRATNIFTLEIFTSHSCDLCSPLASFVC